MNKERYNVTLDEDLVLAAKTKLGMPLSTFFNICLEEHLSSSDDIEEVKKEISDCESHLTFLRSKLCRLEKEKVNGIDSQKDIILALQTLERIHEEHGLIGENQINNIAMFRNVDKRKLLQKCEEEGFNIVKGFEPVKDDKVKKFYS